MANAMKRMGARETARTTHTIRPCITCRQETPLTFFCPCDLWHPLCADCQGRVRHDCAFIHIPLDYGQ